MKKVLRWVVSLGLIAALLIAVDLSEVFEVLRSADPIYLALGAAFVVADRLLMAGKWLPLLRVQQSGIEAYRAIRAYFAASFAQLLLPASVGGDALRAYGLGREQNAVIEVGASVVVERVLGLVGSGVVALGILWVALRADLPMGYLLPWALGCALLGIFAVTVPFSKKVQQLLKRCLDLFEGQTWTGLIERFGSAYHLYKNHARTLTIVGLLSVIEQLGPVLVFWAVARALQLDVSVEALFVAVPLSMFAARIPIAIAGLGVLEGSLMYLLGLYGISSAQAISLALAGRLAELIGLLPGAWWWRELTGGSVDRTSLERSTSRSR